MNYRYGILEIANSAPTPNALRTSNIATSPLVGISQSTPPTGNGKNTVVGSEKAVVGPDNIPVSVRDAFYGENPGTQLAQYLTSKGVEANVSAVVITACSIFFDEASGKTLAKFLNPKSVEAVKSVMADLLGNSDNMLKLSKTAGKGLVFDTLFGALADEVKDRLKLDGAWESAGVDILASTVKNGILSSQSGPGFLLAFQIGFTSDMAVFSTNQTIKAFQKKLELGDTERSMNASMLSLGIQSISAQERADVSFRQIGASANSISESERTSLKNKAKSVKEIGDDGLDTLANGFLNYYNDKGKSLILTNPYPLSNASDVKEAVKTAVSIKRIIDEGGKYNLYEISDGKYRITEAGKLVYRLMDDVPFTAFSNDDKKVQAERFVMLRSFLESVTPNMPIEFYDGMRSSDASSASLMFNRLKELYLS